MKQKRGLVCVIFLSFFLGCQPDNNIPGANQKSKNESDIILYYQNQIYKNPDSIELYQILIDTLGNRANYAEAASWADSAQVHDSTFFINWLLMKANLYRMGKMYEKAIDSYTQYLEYFPNDEQVLLNLANTLAEKGDPKTFALCNLVLQRFPGTENKATTSFIRGIYYSTSGDLNKAIQCFDSTISLRYSFAEAWFERGYCLYDQKKFEESAENFRQLTEIASSDADAWYWLGKSHEAGGNKEKALTDYQRAYGLKGSMTEAKEAIERLK